MTTDRGAWKLVARRDFWVRLRDKGFLVSTLITVSVLSTFILIRAYGGVGGGAFDLGLVRTAATTGDLIAAAAAPVEVRLHVFADTSEATAAVRSGAVDAAIVEGTTVVSNRGVPSPLDAALRVGVMLGGIRDALVERGTSPSEAARLFALPQLSSRTLQATDPNRQENQIVALVAVLLLYGQLFGYGIWVASGVIEEKASRVVEMLLSTIRPKQLLAGKIFGIGALGLMQLTVIAGFGAALASATHAISIPAHAIGILAVTLLWFVFGFAFYASLFAVAGALVSRMEELQNAIVPINLTILGSFFISITSVNGPDSTLSRVAALLPFSSSLAMPVRIAVGAAAPWEIVLSLGILAASIAVLIPLSARLYAGAVLRIGARVKLRDAWRAAA